MFHLTKIHAFIMASTLINISNIVVRDVSNSSNTSIMLMRCHRKLMCTPTAEVHQRHEHAHATRRVLFGAQRSHVGCGKLCKVDVGRREMPVSKEKLAMAHKEVPY
ncbi:unnamed protein product [Musa textilis]